MLRKKHWKECRIKLKENLEKVVDSFFRLLHIDFTRAKFSCPDLSCRSVLFSSGQVRTGHKKIKIALPYTTGQQGRPVLVIISVSKWVICRLLFVRRVHARFWLEKKVQLLSHGKIENLNGQILSDENVDGQTSKWNGQLPICLRPGCATEYY